jgi:hypothetical protein
MSLKTFNKLHEINKLLQLENSKPKIETCDGTNHQISGFVNVDLDFVNRKLLLEKQKILTSCLDQILKEVLWSQKSSVQISILLMAQINL